MQQYTLETSAARKSLNRSAGHSNNRTERLKCLKPSDRTSPDKHPFFEGPGRAPDNERHAHDTAMALLLMQTPTGSSPSSHPAAPAPPLLASPRHAPSIRRHPPGHCLHNRRRCHRRHSRQRHPASVTSIVSRQCQCQSQYVLDLAFSLALAYLPCAHAAVAPSAVAILSGNLLACVSSAPCIGLASKLHWHWYESALA